MHSPPSKAGKINRAWHELHRMPPNATLQQRIAWHREHALHCSCRPMPEKLKQDMERLKNPGKS